MKAKRLPAIIAAVLALCMCAPLSCFAASDFIIRDYDIKMVVNEDDTYEITETVDVEFTAPSHGIYRTIPKQTTLDRDGQLSRYMAGVKSFTMLSGQPCEDESDSRRYMFRIGDEDSYADTNTRYQYSYVYDTKGDHFKGGDEVYHNMVGTAWEAQGIDHVSFEIVFPKDIDMSKVGVKTGAQLSVPFEAVDARTIRGETTENVLRGLTVRAVLPEGYFTRQAGNPVVLLYVVIGGLAALAALGAVMWRKYGRDPVYPDTLELYPPEDISAPEAAYLLKGEINRQDVVSILLTLADKGYLKIHEYEEEKGLRHKKKPAYRIEKQRDYDGDVVGERSFMEGLFADGDVVEVKDLQNRFYKTIELIEKEIRDKYKGRLYDETAASKAKIMYIAGFAGLAVLFIVSRATSGIGLSFDSVIDTLFMFVPLIATAVGFYLAAAAIRNKKRIGSYIGAAALAVFGLGYTRLMGFFWGQQTIPFMIGAALCLLLFIMGGLCEKKTEYYAELQARIKGYTDFLKTAEKDQMEELAEKDPGYYYRNLAYAFALGVTAVYAKRFAALAKEPPEWYDSYYIHSSDFDSAGMLDSINSMTNSVSASMSSSPSDGSGGGSFSGGGGGGGGGGGSW